ncbi:MAG: hypothetical protein IT342_21735 [Candidatus Melainabacteria bacterium]|nr:hypothetical protein [Candidatus Melainabacteria bacterium]
MNKNFVKMPGGRLVRMGNRFGGHDAEHYTFCRLERNRVAMRIRNREFAQIVAGVIAQPQPDQTWTILEPMSGKYHTRTYIIEGDADTAIRVYAARNGGRHPEKVSCDCGCGPDYGVHVVHGSLAFATAFIRRCSIAEDFFGTEFVVEGVHKLSPGRYDYHSLDQFLSRDDVTLICDADISPDERDHPLPHRTHPAMYSQDAQVVAWLLDMEM